MKQRGTHYQNTGVNAILKARAWSANRDILPAAYELLPDKMNTPQATVLLLAIGLQESELVNRTQKRNGPARGLWQFEMVGGGVDQVLEHHAVKANTAAVCKAHSVPLHREAIHAALEYDDVLAAALARLLLWTDPEPLPALDDLMDCWWCYQRVWRPGQPRQQDWLKNFNAAKVAVLGAL